MMSSNAWCQGKFGGMGQALFPQTGQGAVHRRQRLAQDQGRFPASMSGS